ncbi:alpha/beta hydrolase [uncultured Brevundimonas sp.]|uniref:alpha/beta fold hydrolase n=1 Tax=uncultured Brevundimonas sp. TaxID=213418 RepID=UPI002623A0AF|nr:alpha/beta hydrolase [uncultured Brevundimonas sp.]
MPLLFIARTITGLLSLLILGTAIYLGWSWWVGETAAAPDGEWIRVGEDWRLWLALGLLLWSFGGRLVLPFILAKTDGVTPQGFPRAESQLTSPTGARLYVEKEGEDGPTILLTHGWGLDSTIWSTSRSELGRLRSLQPHRLLVWDLPGLGKSKTQPGCIGPDAFAKELAFLLEEATEGPVILVGHSIGGMTMQSLIRQRPDLFGSRVVGVVLLNTTYTNPLRTMILSRLALALRRPLLEPLMHLMIWLQPLAWLCAWQSYLSGSAHLANRIGFGPDVTRAQLDHVSLLVTRNSPGVQARGNLAMFRWDASGAISAAACPTLIIGGELDLVTKLEASEAIASQGRSARLCAVPRANHMGFLEQANAYHSEILQFARALAMRDSPKAPLP